MNREISWQCCECKTINSTIIDIAMKPERLLLICGNCGLVNDSKRILSVLPDAPIEASYLECIPFQGSEKKNIPIGLTKLLGPKENWLWVGIDNVPMNRINFIKRYGRDPERWWIKYRGKID